MYRIRFHGRGGQGIKTASRILGTAFFLEGFEVQDAPRYGAERRGAPIFAYVRASKRAINERGVIRHPDLVVVADDTLVPVPTAGVLSGVTQRSLLLINSAEPVEVWMHRLNVTATVLTLPVSAEVGDASQTPFVGATCAGAAARLVGVISRESLAQAIEAELATLGAPVVKKNLDNARHAYDAMESQAGLMTEGEEITANTYENPGWIDLPFEDARMSAPAIHAISTSVEVKTGLWRTMRPVLYAEHCHGCWWVCSTFCPDSAINVNNGRPEIDYDHCKGCMICVAVCPHHAIEAIPEQTAQAQETGRLG